MPAIRSNSASKPSASIQRVYSDVILPIKPHFVELMLAGKKNHEYRKYKLRDTVVRLWLYEVSPASRIRYVMRTAKPKTPGEVNDPSGIGNDDFDKGLKQSKFGYPVLEISRLESPVSSQAMKSSFGVSVPQSYCFVPKDMFESVKFVGMEPKGPDGPQQPKEEADAVTDDKMEVQQHD